MPIELGPVFRFETRRVAGRKGWYAARVVLGLGLLAFLGLYHWVFHLNLRLGMSPRWVKDFLVQVFTRLLVIPHLVAAFLIAPAAAANALSRERVRAMLPMLLATGFPPWRIVLETFTARVVPGLSLWLCLLPATVIGVAWCGIDPEFALILEAVTLGTIILVVAAAVGLSLWTGRTAQALVGVYGLGAGWLLSWHVVPALARVNPYLLLVSAWNGNGRPTLRDAWLVLGVTVLSSALVLLLATVTLRAVALAPPRAGARRSSRPARLNWLERLPGPTLDGNPVLWREWWRARASLAAKGFWALYILFALTATAMGVHAFWQGQLAGPDLARVTGFEAGLGLLALAVRAAAAWSEERFSGRQGLDVLLVTPLSASTVVSGKWWGVYRGVLLVAVLPALGAVILASGAPSRPILPPGLILPVEPVPIALSDRLAMPVVVLGHVLLSGAMFVSLGLLLATRFRHPLGAVVATVGVYAFVALVVPTVAEFMYLGTNRALGEGLGLVSPVAGPIVTLLSMFNPFFSSPRQMLVIDAVWLALIAVVAWTLRRWTVYSFDRWMGRMAAAADD